MSRGVLLAALLLGGCVSPTRPLSAPSSPELPRETVDRGAFAPFQPESAAAWIDGDSVRVRFWYRPAAQPNPVYGHFDLYAIFGLPGSGAWDYFVHVYVPTTGVQQPRREWWGVGPYLESRMDVGFERASVQLAIGLADLPGLGAGSDCIVRVNQGWSRFFPL